MKYSLVSALALVTTIQAEDWCRVNINSIHTQGVGNPDGTNTSNYYFFVVLTLADGRTQRIEPNTAPPFDNYCIQSMLPYQMCVTSNRNLKDGYLDYAADHADFNDSDRCNGRHDVNPFSATNIVTCRFKC